MAVPKQYSFKLLQEITDDFSEQMKIGKDGQGIIYKGVEKDGTEIAVKLLHTRTTEGSNDDQLDEVDRTLVMFPHQNILRLVGHCHEARGNYLPGDGKIIILEEKKMAICFEYMHNRSLREYLSEKSNENDWSTRYEIIKGICNGLKHLHEGLDVPIICHLDLKLDNILLGDQMVPKIANFSFSMIMKEEQVQSTSSHRENDQHHLPPEYTKRGVISTKLDIFSLGVLIIQIMNGPEGYFRNTESSAEQFIERVHVLWRKRLQATNDLFSEQVKKCIKIGVSCMKGDRSKRPSIGAIVKDLNSNVTKVRLPDSLGNNSELSADQENNSLEHESVAPVSPAYPSLLEEMIDGFSLVQRLGSGPHGEVYMGRLNDEKLIAVKTLDNKAGFHNERFAEYLELARRKHENVMQLKDWHQITRREHEMHDGKIVHADVTRRVLCFEYLQSLDTFLSESSGHDWAERFLIIRGVCEGLKYLHEELGYPHMDLKPTNVLLDDKRVPKLDFGLSRLFDKGKVHIGNTSDEPLGYKQPGCIDVNAEKKSDIHRLGLLIIEIISGPTKIPYENLTNHVYEDWRKKLQQTSRNAELWAGQAMACTETALSCVVDKDQTPSISHIIKQLDVLDYVCHLKSMFPIAPKDQSSSCLPTEVELPSEVELLDVHPPQLRFPFEPNKLICCPLRLTNITDDRHVAFRCIPKPSGSILNVFSRKESYVISKLSEFRGILPPRSSLTYVLSVQMQQEEPANLDALGIIIESCTARKGMQGRDVKDSFFQQASTTKQNGSDVHSVTLTAVCDPMAAGDTMSLHELAQPRIKIVYTREETLGRVTSIDLHPTEPWILAGHATGYISIWNYETQESPRTLRIGEPSRFHRYVGMWIRSTKFVARRKWFLVADMVGYIHVRTIMSMEEVKMFKAHHLAVGSLEVNPIDPYVLSTGDGLIKLWDWENDWVCIREFKVDRLSNVRFNPQDWNTFASVSEGVLKIWDISSGNHIVAFNCNAFPSCVDYIFSGGDRQYVLIGCLRGTAEVLDSKTKKCFPLLVGLQKSLSGRSNVAVINRPQPDGGPTLVAASSDSCVILSNSSTYRDAEVFQFNLGKVRDFVSTERAQSLAIAFDDGIAIMDVL